MNAKLVLALIVALQVSTCLCDMPVPDKELVDKYEEYKATFYKRLLNAYKRMQGAVVPMAEGMEQGAIVKEYMEQLQADPKMQSAVKVITGVAGELGPVVDKARSAALGLYGEYLRPYIGQSLDQAIQNLKPMLDAVMPADE
ncbi:apolipoprotein A-II [Engraulis encrasicolus]|uniref:apolipoprotein A-II n=1 Tax=Engraulis encrasicolus TaxID=184585 RepID=UPI002FD7599F